MSSYRTSADSSIPGTTTNTSQRSSSAVRSRTRRLVSFNDDEDAIHGKPLQASGLSSLTPDLPASRSRSTTPSPFPSRGVSPIPKSHLPRGSASPSRGGSNSPLGLLDLSWSSLQSMASSVLGSDIARPASNGAARGHVRKPSRPDPYMRNAPPTSTPSSWGPSGPPSPEIGSGTKEERQALVQAKKREALLYADSGPSYDPKSRHKRRDSGDQTNQLAIDPEQDEDALAYIHHVQPTDSITGVTIRYGCQPAIFRKANGFWPSDSIQGRKTVLLPVESCSIKGRPIHKQVNLLDGENASHSPLEDMSGSSIAPAASAGNTPKRDTFPDSALEVEGDRIWKHESYVQIDGLSAPVEIGRVPRRALGFFPRTRRKSVSVTDSESPSVSVRGRTETISSTSSPTEPQASPQNLTGIPETHASNYKPTKRHQRQRSNIQLAGPGVGTLDRKTAAPGPALDGLTKFVAQHLPQFAPATPPPDFRESSEYTSTSVSNTTTGLDNLGGAVEGWMRKMTTRAKSSFSEFQRAQSYQSNNSRSSSTGRRGMGDLIELNDGLESRNSSGIFAGPQASPNISRPGSGFNEGAALRRGGRFSSPSDTSRTRTERYKDD